MNLGGRAPMPASGMPNVGGMIGPQPVPMSGAPGVPQYGGGVGGGMLRPGMTAPSYAGGSGVFPGGMPGVNRSFQSPFPIGLPAQGAPPMATAGQGMPMPNAHLPMAQQLARGLMQR